MKTECFEDVKQEELLDQSHELEIQTQTEDVPIFLNVGSSCSQ